MLAYAVTSLDYLVSVSAYKTEYFYFTRNLLYCFLLITNYNIHLNNSHQLGGHWRSTFFLFVFYLFNLLYTIFRSFTKLDTI